MILSIFVEDHIPDFMEAGIIQGLVIVNMIFTNIIIGMLFLIYKAQRLEIDLPKANEEIKILSGFLPICSNCKKIRNDEGDWEDPEHYIQKHSEADFTHGICPDCMEILYNDIDE